VAPVRTTIGTMRTLSKREGTIVDVPSNGASDHRVEKVHHPVFARMYLRSVTRRVATGEDRYRRKLLVGLCGRVIELGAGSGINFSFYPQTVEHVLAVEPEPLLRAEANKNAAKAAVPVTVVDGVSSQLPAEDHSLDGAVASLVLCSVPDQQRALVELRRVLRPDGELRFYEHVIAHQAVAARLQRLADMICWPRVAGGCHLARDTSAALELAGFTIERCERFTFSPGPPVPPIPHILGIARRQPRPGR
jgi:ubiquinone/menaquinone biosynthesis C-methylase UbiE